jgi:hypothetical protein
MPLIALGLATTATLALAGPTGQAVLNAVAFEPVPAAAAIEVRVLDDSDENLAIKRELESALAGRGFPVGGASAPLVLTIDTGENVGAWRTSSDTNVIQLKDDRGRLFPQGTLDVTNVARLPLPSTTVVTPAQYRLGLTLDSRASGDRLWQGWTIADLSQGQSSELAQAMVPKLAASVGETVREQSFDLQPAPQ